MTNFCVFGTLLAFRKSSEIIILNWDTMEEKKIQLSDHFRSLKLINNHKVRIFYSSGLVEEVNKSQIEKYRLLKNDHCDSVDNLTVITYKNFLKVFDHETKKITAEVKRCDDSSIKGTEVKINHDIIVTLSFDSSKFEVYSLSLEQKYVFSNPMEGLFETYFSLNHDFLLVENVNANVHYSLFMLNTTSVDKLYELHEYCIQFFEDDSTPQCSFPVKDKTVTVIKNLADPETFDSKG